MRTNHARGFVAATPRDGAMWTGSARCPLSGRSVGASIGNDFSGGRRGMAAAKRGAKKFLRSRIRFAGNAASARLAAAWNPGRE